MDFFHGMIWVSWFPADFQKRTVWSNGVTGTGFHVSDAHPVTSEVFTNDNEKTNYWACLAVDIFKVTHNVAALSDVACSALLTNAT